MKGKQDAAPEAEPEQDEIIEEAEEVDVDPIAALRRERDEYLTNWQRSQADYQNLRRRHQSELDSRVRVTLQPLLEDLLLVMDHMEMALASPVESEDAKNLAFGVELVKKQLDTLLENQSVERIDEGGRFDPELHQAISTEERSDVDHETILDTTRRGYTWRGKPLRFAQVRVSNTPSEGDASEDVVDETSD